MGYYVNIIDQEFFLDKKHFDDVYQKMCLLNDFHELKRGGSYGGNEDVDKTSRYPKNKWFSWMEHNYPETCENLQEILHQIGFDLKYDEDGNLVRMWYDNKTGNEDYFLCCFAGFVKDESYITFQGEDGPQWRYFFKDGKMYLQNGLVEISFEEDGEVYEFGKMSKADCDLEKWKQEYAQTRKEKQLEEFFNN